MDRPPGVRTCLYDTAQLEAVMDDLARRMAHWLRGRSRTAVIGIRRRGAPLADRLCARLAGEGLAPPQRLDLAISRYADDLTLLHPETRLVETPEQAALDLAGHTLVVVDDVLYTGHSLLKAVEYLVRRRAAAVRSVVLVDRGVAQLPVHADLAALRLEVAPGDVVECNVPPFEPAFRIELLQRPAPQHAPGA